MTADVEKLRKELERKTKSFEGKLATLTAINSALQTENDKLRKQLAEAEAPKTKGDAEVAELKEEFARRLGAADRQIAQLQDDKDRLRQQLQLASQGGTASEARIHEKEEHIKSLQREGEKLSRRNGELEATTRKLRAQLRDAESERDRLAGRVEGLEVQLEEAQQRGQQAEQALADQAAAHEAELQEMQRSAELRLSVVNQQAQDDAHRSLEQAARESAEALAAAIDREAGLTHNIAQLRAQLEEWEEREADWRGETSALESRVRDLEAVSQALQANTTDATRPLLRQIESLAAAASHQQAAARETEQRLSQRVKQAEAQLAGASEAQRAAMARAEAAEDAAAAARDAAHAAAASVADVKARCEAEQARCAALQQQVGQLEEALRVRSESTSQLLAAKEAEVQERLWDAEEQLRSIAAQKAAIQGLSAGVATRSNGAQQEQQQPNSGAASPGRLKNSSRGSRLALLAAEEAGPNPQGAADSGGGSSRDSSNRRIAVHGSAAANGSGHGVTRGAPDAGGVVGAEEDEMDEMLRSMSLHHSASVPLALLRRQSSAADKESSLIALLEDQVSVLERSAAAANEALAQALARAGELEGEARRAAALKRHMEQLQAKHSLLLEVLGERHERVEQLEEDVRDMKAIFHQQLNVAVDQLAQARAELERLGIDVEQLKGGTSTPESLGQDRGQRQQQPQTAAGRGDTDERDMVGREGGG
ncbi:hypothetical protein N2152v2_006839 [Parachlorella kessleri]